MQGTWGQGRCWCLAERIPGQRCGCAPRGGSFIVGSVGGAGLVLVFSTCSVLLFMGTQHLIEAAQI